MIELNGSTRNERETPTDPALNHSKTVTGKDPSLPACLAAYTSKNIMQLIINEIRITPQPTIAAVFLDKIFLANPIIKNPIKGKSGTNQIKFIILYTFAKIIWLNFYRLKLPPKSTKYIYINRSGISVNHHN